MKKNQLYFQGSESCARSLEQQQKKEPETQSYKPSCFHNALSGCYQFLIFMVLLPFSNLIESFD